MPPHLKNWVNVPHGSTLRVKVSGDVPSRGHWQLAKGGAVVDSGEATDTQLRHGFRRTVRRAETVSIVVFLTFVEEAERTGRVGASVTKPDGSTHGTAFNRDAAGKAGDPEVHIFISARGVSE